MKKCFRVVPVCAAVFLACAHADAAPVQDTEEARRYFENELNFNAGFGEVKEVSEGKRDGILVDLRKEEDFKHGHIPGAINLPFDRYQGFEGPEDTFPGLSKEKINYLYCYELLCNLSHKAARKLASLGYPVKEIRGGFKSWKEHGFHVKK